MSFKRNRVRSWEKESDGNKGEGEVRGDWKGNDGGNGEMADIGGGSGGGSYGDGRTMMEMLMEAMVKA